MRVLIIDSSKARMQTVRRRLARELPDVEVSEFDPEQHGKPRPSFRWSLYDVALIGDDLDHAGTAFDWLREFGRLPGFPPAVIMLANPDVTLAAKAVRAGAHGVVSKHELSSERLAAVVSEAGAGREAQQGPADDVTQRDLQVFREHLWPRTGAGWAQGYRFRRLVGQGAMSRVYLAERIDDDLTVVLKILDGKLASDPEAIRRFAQEAELVSTIRSPHVVRVYDHGFTNRYGFIAMELFSRGDLKQRLERGVPRRAAMRYMLEIAMGLQAIHEAGIVHRDLKPANIMFRADETLALADFGMSKNLNETTQLTLAGDMIGTPYYMSPEQIRAEPVDPRSDLYSLGVLCFEMLAGYKPYGGSSMDALIRQHLFGEPPRLPDGCDEFQPVIERLMAKRPEERYRDAAEAVAALQSIACAA